MEEIVLNAALDWLGGQALAGTQTLLSSLSLPKHLPLSQPCVCSALYKDPL